VFAVYQARQREFEREPVDLFERRLPDELAAVRRALGACLRAPADDLALVLNATSALNLVAALRAMF
jgi:selenocysteine lyase/cysteine desulfurase